MKKDMIRRNTDPIRTIAATGISTVQIRITDECKVGFVRTERLGVQISTIG
jgi:hypothetical protein